MIRVLFFASLREALGCGELTLDAHDHLTLAAVKATLAERFPAWQSLQQEQEILTAVNQTLCRADCDLRAGDEVAFFPQVTGG